MMSDKTGMKKAFIEYIDNEGILLRPNHPPIIGADAIDFLSQVNDSSYNLTWEPTGAEIAAFREYGIYLRHLQANYERHYFTRNLCKHLEKTKGW